MKIAACYIVKNEEKNLERSLKSIECIADAIYIADTGSTDNTVDIAKRYTNNIYFYKWLNDFAAARNFIIDKIAPGFDWIMVLDADEWFVEPEKVRPFMEWLTAQNSLDEAVMCTLLDIEKEGGREWHRWSKIIFFRQQANLRYEGAIHETLRNTDRPDDSCLPVLYRDTKNIFIWHTGYNGTVVKEKCERNLAILLEDIEKCGEIKPHHYYYLADCYHGLKDYKSSLYNAKMSLDGNYTVGANGEAYKLILDSMRNLHYKDSDMLVYADEAIEKMPKLPDFYAEKGMILCGMGDYQAAIESFEKAVVLYRDGDYGGESSSFGGYLYKVYERMAELYAVLGNAEKETVYRNLLQKEKKINSKDMERVKIAVCYIVKDEARGFEHSLKSVADIADGIFVADTGSTDDTVAIARKYTENTYHYEWKNDFAAARNFIIDQVTQDYEWIIMLDADESFYKPERVRMAINDAIQQDPVSDVIMPIYIDVDADRGDKEFHRWSKIGIFRHNVGLKYFGAIHESLGRTGEPGEKLEIYRANDLHIRHTGYSLLRVQAKARRDLTILEAEIQEKGIQPYHYRYLADCYYILQDYAKTIEYAITSLEQVKSADSDADMYHKILESMYKLKMSRHDRLKLLYTAIERYPDLPDFYGERGLLYFELRDYPMALGDLEKAVSLYNDADLQAKNYEVSCFEAIVPRVERYLGDLWAMSGDKVEALTHYGKAKAKDAQGIELFKSLGRICDTKVLGEFYDSNEAFIARAAEKIGNIELYKKYRGKQPQEKNAALVYDLYSKDIQPDKLLAIANEMVQDLFGELLHLKHISHTDEVQEMVKLLPTPMGELVRATWGQQEDVSEEAFAIHEILLPIAKKQGAEIYAKYCSVLSGLNEA